MLFTTCVMPVQLLPIAKRDFKLSRPIKLYTRYERMVIDDLGYTRQTWEETEVVFKLPAERIALRRMRDFAEKMRSCEETRIVDT